MRLARTKIEIQNLSELLVTNDSATWSIVMSRNVRNYSAQGDEPPTVTTEVFPRNESDGTLFSKFPCKRVLPDGEAIDCPWLI